MKRFLTFATLSLCLTAGAQTNPVSVRPANDSQGKILTMEETILSRELSAKRFRAYFDKDGNYTEQAPEKVQVEKLPDGAANAMKSDEGAYAYTIDNDLYIKDGEKTVSVASSNDSNIIYGQTVSRNEFGIRNGIFWSPDGSKLAFYRKDESRVTTFPLLDITSRTGSLVSIKYPMAGMDSEIISLGVYDMASGSTVYMKVDDFDSERYLTNISWAPDSKRVYIQILDRSQRHVHLNAYDASSGDFLRTILTEDNERFVEPQDPIRFVKGSLSQFIYRTDNRDGFRNLYLCDTLGSVRRLTCVDADVEYIGNDGKDVYYTSAEVSPVENHLFKVSLGKKQKVTRLTFGEGWHEVSLSPDFKQFIDRYSSLCNPGTTELRTTDGKLVRTLNQAEDPTQDYAYSEIELGTVRSADGKYDNWYRLIRPKDFDPSKKYPVIVYVYGGPHSQMVQNTWLAQLRRWEMYMAQRGYLVYVQDNRGTQNRGAEFEKAIYKQCGQCEMADQMEGVKMLMSLPYVDKDRIGVHGWSYGGFMTISLITNYPDIFKVAVAGGPVIDWKWYEVMYGERYMSTPQENPEGFEKTSLINKAKDLKGKLLICQGAIDNTVVWEHSLSFIRECIKNNVQVDYFPYPCAEHNVMGKDRIHLMDKVSIYFEDYL